MNFTKNWKTSGAGIATILIAIGTALGALADDNPETQVDFNLLIPALIAGVGLLFSRDGDK